MSELSTATAATSVASTDRLPALVGGNFRAVPFSLTVYYGSDTFYHMNGSGRIDGNLNLYGGTRAIDFSATAGGSVDFKIESVSGSSIGQLYADTFNFQRASGSTTHFIMGLTGNTSIRPLTCSSWVKPASFTVSTLPSAATAGAGARAYVTDSNSTTFNATVAGGGANKIGVISDGANWKIG